jgi:hypothetical protein
MYVKLAGRVTFEQNDDGLRIAIPVRPGPFVAIYAPLVLFWVGLATAYYWKVLVGPHPEDLNFDLQQIAIAIYVAGFLFFLWWMAWTMAGDTHLILSPPQVKIQNRIFGIPLVSDTYRADQIHRIHFVPHKRIKTQRAIFNPNSSCIRFEVKGRSEIMAKGVTEEEARVLIDKMLQVYQFPRSWF